MLSLFLLVLLVLIIIIFYILYSLNYKWKIYQISSIIFLGIFIIINLIIIPIFESTIFARDLFLLSIGPGLLIINLINSLFSSEVSFTIKFILMFLYSAVIWFLFGYLLGWVYFVFSNKKTLKNKFKKQKQTKQTKQIKNKKTKAKQKKPNKKIKLKQTKTNLLNIQKRSKGQISIETIALTSVLIISTIVVGVVYFNNLNSENKENTNLDIAITNIKNKLSNDNFSNINVIKLQDPCDSNFHCFNSILDCDEEDIGCGGSNCIPCEVSILDMNFEESTIEPLITYQNYEIVADIFCNWEPCDCNWLDGQNNNLGTNCNSLIVNYKIPGNKQVILNARDSYEFTDTKTLSFDIIQDPDFFTTNIIYPTSTNYFTYEEEVEFFAQSDCENPVLYTWTSNIDDVLYTGFDNSFKISDMNVGFHNITLRAYDIVTAKSFEDKTSIIRVIDEPTIFSVVLNSPHQAYYVLGSNILFYSYSSSNYYPDVIYEWSSDIDGLLKKTENPSRYYYFNRSDLNVGKHLITMKATNLPTGEIDEKTKLIEIIEPEDFTVEIDNPKTGAVFTFKEEINFLSNESCSHEIDFEWTSSIDGVIGNQEDINFSSLSLGNHIITVTARDVLTNISEQDTVDIEIVDYATPYNVTIDSPLNNSSYIIDSKVNFYSSLDSSDPSNYEWISSRNGILSNNANFQTVNLEFGQHTITLNANNLLTGESSQDQIILNIISEVELFINEPINNSIYPENTEITFSSYINGFLDLDYLWTSNINGELSTNPSFITSDLDIGLHNITLIAYNESSGVFLSENTTLEIVESENINFKINNNSENTDFFKISKLPNSAVYINWNNNIITEVPIEDTENIFLVFSDYLSFLQVPQNITIYPASSITSFVTNSELVQGNLSTAFSNCNNLIELNLNSTDFSGDIGLFNITFENSENLEKLDLGNTNVTGSIDFLNNNSNLRYLDLSNNNILGNIDTFNYLTYLETLNLSNCTNLYYISVHVFQLGSDLSSRGYLIDLSDISLSTSEINNLLTAFDGPFCNIYVLDISGNDPDTNSTSYNSLISKGWSIID
jgi:hypothetical protein